MPFVNVGDVRFHYQRKGEGPETIVFLHGLVMDNLSSWWYTVASAASKHYETLVYDLRGHGLTDRPVSGYGVADSLDDLVGILDALGIDRPVHLVGNSYGGVLALAFAVTYPERAASLVLVEAHAALEGHEHEDADKVAGGLELAGWFLEEEEVQDWLSQLGGRKLNKMAASAKELFFECTLIEDLRDSPPFTDAELRGISCPVLALYGDNSDILARSRELADLIPDCELRLVPDCTHSVLMEAVPEIRRQVIEWVGTHPSAPRAVGV